MERLTNRDTSVCGEYKVCCAHFNDDDCKRVSGNCVWCRWNEKAWELLCEYEDTGLSPDEVNNIKPCSGFLFSKRKKLAQEFEKWEAEVNAKSCPESVIAYLYQNGFLATNRILNYLKLIEEEENERKIDV